MAPKEKGMTQNERGEGGTVSNVKLRAVASHRRWDSLWEWLLRPLEEPSDKERPQSTLLGRREEGDDQDIRTDGRGIA